MRVKELAEIAAGLYTAPLAEFVAERAARAEEATDRALARRIRALRKPSVAAWIVNVFARERSDRLGEVLQLAEELREAQADLDAPTLAQLGRQRRTLTLRLAQEAVSLVEGRGAQVTDSTRQAVQQTLTAAFFSPEAASAVASGRLVRELVPGGEGAEDLDAIVGGGRPEQNKPPAHERTDELQARRVRRAAEREVHSAEQDLARARRDHEELEMEQRELGARARRLAERAAELESELLRIREESARAAAALDGLSGRRTDTANRVVVAEKALAHARDAVEQLPQIPGGATGSG